MRLTFWLKSTRNESEVIATDRDRERQRVTTAIISKETFCKPIHYDKSFCKCCHSVVIFCRFSMPLHTWRVNVCLVLFCIYRYTWILSFVNASFSHLLFQNPNSSFSLFFLVSSFARHYAFSVKFPWIWKCAIYLFVCVTRKTLSGFVDSMLIGAYVIPILNFDDNKGFDLVFSPGHWARFVFN